MGLRAWFARVIDSGDKTETAASQAAEMNQAERDFQGLEMHDAIDAHLRWNDRLRAYVSGQSEESLDPETVSCDDKCVLGHWIYETAKPQYDGMEEFETLRSDHAEFHQTAGQIVRLKQQGNTEQASALFDPLRRQSGSVQLSLVGLYLKVKGAR